MRSVMMVAMAAVAAASFPTAAMAVEEITFFQSTQLTPERIVTYTPGAVSTLSILGTTGTGHPALGVALALLKPAFGPATAMFLPVDVVMTATSTALVTSTGLQFEQGGFAGSIVYSWDDPASMTTMNLLTATFTEATLNVDLGATPSGSFFATNPFQTVSYASDVFDVASVIEADFALGFSSITTAFFVTRGVGTAFQANVVGTFAAAVPEPATWAMMIAGFGMVGFAARRRRATATVSA